MILRVFCYMILTSFILDHEDPRECLRRLKIFFSEIYVVVYTFYVMHNEVKFIINSKVTFFCYKSGLHFHEIYVAHKIKKPSMYLWNYES